MLKSMQDWAIFFTPVTIQFHLTVGAGQGTWWERLVEMTGVETHTNIYIYIYIYIHTHTCAIRRFFFFFCYLKFFCLNGFSKFFVVCKFRLSWLWVLYLYDFVMSLLCLGCGIEKLRLHLDFGNQFLKVFVLHSNVWWKLTM